MKSGEGLNRFAEVCVEAFLSLRRNSDVPMSELLGYAGDSRFYRLLGSSAEEIEAIEEEADRELATWRERDEIDS